MENETKEKIAKVILKLRISQMIVNEEYKKNNFKIPIHLALGHESICVAVSNIMSDNDKLILSHRNIAYNLVRLNKLKPILDEYFLKSDGLMHGKTGSMNLINPEKGVIYSSSILGNNFSVGTGVALAQKMKDDGIVIILGGDGSIEEGPFHESLLMLKSLDLSALLIIENNEWSMSTRIHERRHPVNLEKFAESYDVKYVKMSGNDPFEYIEKLEKLRKISIETRSPILIELMVTTLGEWILKTPEIPDGKFVNYHAGPTPSVDLEKCQIKIKDNLDDPIFVLEKHFGKDYVEKLAEDILTKLKEEIK